jgi:hypothetical protein
VLLRRAIDRRRLVRVAASSLAMGAFVVACAGAKVAPPRAAGCLADMARVDDAKLAHGSFCIDRFEASLVEVGAGGEERPHSPFDTVKSANVRAVAREGLVPQAYISRNEAADACKRSSKRLCTEAEWVRACTGAQGSTFPYGAKREPGVCNDDGKPPLATLYSKPGAPKESWEAVNDPRLNQLPGTVAKTGSHPGCKSAFGVFDMMGNLHEWVADPEGTFLGGYYLDTKLNGDGCHYKTVAHGAAYHDYSTGFRCCADVR